MSGKVDALPLPVSVKSPLEASKQAVFVRAAFRLPLPRGAMLLVVQFFVNALHCRRVVGVVRSEVSCHGHQPARIEQDRIRLIR